MSYAYDHDTCRDSAGFLADQEAWEQHQARHQPGPRASCAEGGHSYMPTGYGGGTCRHCGDTIDPDEL